MCTEDGFPKVYFEPKSVPLFRFSGTEPVGIQYFAFVYIIPVSLYPHVFLQHCVKFLKCITIQY